MKKLIYLFLTLLTVACSIDNSGNDTSSATPSLGSFYEGGVVFYIFRPGDAGYVSGETHGLIAAVEDQSTQKQWYNGSNGSGVTTGATYIGLGTGSANTDIIISAHGGAQTSYAAGLARAYNGGGYSDWYLPSKDELDKMYFYRSTINTTAASNGGSSFISAYYWSSSEYGSSTAWLQSFPDGNQNNLYKSSSLAVRAVRAF